jgi:hypothetical protein
VSDVFDGIVIGAAAAAIGTIVAFKFLSRTPQGGEQPDQVFRAYPAAVGGRPLRVVNPPFISDTEGGILSQDSAITEAAYNQYPVNYAPAFGQTVNRFGEEAVLPV